MRRPTALKSSHAATNGVKETKIVGKQADKARLAAMHAAGRYNEAIK